MAKLKDQLIENQMEAERVLFSTPQPPQMTPRKEELYDFVIRVPGKQYAYLECHAKDITVKKATGLFTEIDRMFNV